MGFLDKIKDAAKNAAEQLEKKNAEAEQRKALAALKYYGSVSGPDVPEKAEYCLDSENKRLVIRFKEGEVVQSYSLVREFSYDDVVDFKLEEEKQSDYDSFSSMLRYFIITLNTGEKFKICHIVSTYADQDENEFSAQRHKRNVDALFDILLSFMIAIEDAKTKALVNALYQSENLLPVYDETGEFSAENMNANTDSLLNR